MRTELKKPNFSVWFSSVFDTPIVEGNNDKPLKIQAT